MRRIVLTISGEIFVQPIMSILLSGRDFFPQVVTVSTGTVNDLAEQAHADHIQYHQFSLTVITVFQEHIWCTGSLLGSDKLVALFYRISTADLTSHRNALFHAVGHYLCMVFPGGDYNHAVNKILVDQLFVISRFIWAWMTCVFYQICNTFHTVLVNIADSRNSDVIHFKKHLVCQTVSTQAKANDAYTNLFHTDTPNFIGCKKERGKAPPPLSLHKGH